MIGAQFVFLAAVCGTAPLLQAGEPSFAVDVLPACKEFPRNSEGAVIERADGSLLLVATRFYGGTEDAAQAHLAARESRDGGRTWSAPVVVQENIGARNVMSASLARLSAARTPDGARAAGPIGLFFLVKNGDADLKVHVRASHDEGRTWSPPRCVTDRPGYHVMNNDRVVRLSTGRLLCPVAFTADCRKVDHYRSLCFLSDDAGATWRAGRGDADLPKRGAMEPEVIERKDRSLLMLLRSQLGRNYAAVSSDGGETWSKPAPFGPPAPEAPSTLRRIPGTERWLLVFNPKVVPGQSHGGRRTPLSAAVSSDEGATWSSPMDIESRADETYAYTSLVFSGGRALMTYYVEHAPAGMLTLRFRSLPVEQLAP